MFYIVIFINFGVPEVLKESNWGLLGSLFYVFFYIKDGHYIFKFRFVLGLVPPKDALLGGTCSAFDQFR